MDESAIRGQPPRTGRCSTLTTFEDGVPLVVILQSESSGDGRSESQDHGHSVGTSFQPMPHTIVELPFGGKSSSRENEIVAPRIRASVLLLTAAAVYGAVVWSVLQLTPP